MSALKIISFIKEKYALKYYPLTSKFFGIEYQPKKSIEDYIINKILITTDLSYKSLIFALKNKVNFIITYYGLLNSPIRHFDYLLIKKLNLLSKFSSIVFTLNSSIVASEYGTSATLGEVLFLKTVHLFKINQNKKEIPIGRICLPNRYPHSNESSFTLENLINRVKANLELANLNYSGNLNKKIERICIIATNISKIKIAKKLFDHKCDCLICSNIDSKHALFAKEIKLCFIEIPFLKVLRLTLKKFHKILSLEYPNKKVYFFDSSYPIQKY
ncbi:MAG: Nif3-like dinuclear metal center hexameric protein [Minisyncoccales bacterium]